MYKFEHSSLNINASLTDDVVVSNNRVLVCWERAELLAYLVMFTCGKTSTLKPLRMAFQVSHLVVKCGLGVLSAHITGKKQEKNVFEK